MNRRNSSKGFTLIEVIVAVAVFVIFALGIYGTLAGVFRIVYASRVQIIGTTVLEEQLEIIKNMPYENVGTSGGVPSGILSSSQIITRNGIRFNVTTTVRNVDDAADGVLGGSPSDLSSADYKLVELSAQCITCALKKPVVLSTRISPRRLEGASANGALFIHVFDADGNDLQGATVRITNTSTVPAIDITDVTDAFGMYQIVNAPTSSLGYTIVISKSGYSTDGTITQNSVDPSDSTNLPATVATQTITEANFAIDLLSSLAISTKNASCVAVGSQSLTLASEKLIGTDPDIPKLSAVFSTDASGAYSFPSIEWDNYDITLNGNTYDIGGSTPMLPLDLDPGVAQNLSIVLVPHTTNALLVKVIDSGTGLPVSGANVEIIDSSGAKQSLTTGVGYIRQTDWSDGSGQASYTNTKKYWSNSGNVDDDSPKGDLTLKKSGHTYAASGWLESSTIDFTNSVNFNNVIFDPISQPAQTGANSVQLQIATSASSSPTSWSFVGPDGTSATYYTPQSTLLHASLSGKRYLRYRVYLYTNNTAYTPTLSELAFTYTNSCTPPGQAFFSNLSADTYTVNVTSTGYDFASDSIDVADYTTTDVTISEEE